MQQTTDSNNKPKKSQNHAQSCAAAVSSNHNNINLNCTTAAGVFNTANKANLNKIRRTLCSYFILSLGFCDLFICIVHLPMNALQEINCIRDYLIKMFQVNDLDILCKLGYFFLQIPIILEIEILFTIAWDRYSSVFKPIKLYFFDINKLIFTLVLQLVCASLLSLPNLFFIAKTTQNDHYTRSYATIENNKTTLIFLNNELAFCKVNEQYMVIYSWYQCFLCLLFFMNLFIISIFYIKVYKHIYKASKHQRLQNASNSIQSRNSMTTLQLPVSVNGSNLPFTSNMRQQTITTLNDMITTTSSNNQNNNNNINQDYCSLNIQSSENEENFVQTSQQKAKKTIFKNLMTEYTYKH